MNDVDIVLMDFLLCLSHLDLIPSNSIHLIAYERYLQKAGGKQTLCSHQQSTWLIHLRVMMSKRSWLSFLSV